MKYYRDKTNQVYAFESDGSQDTYITSSMILMTEQEVESYLAPKPATAEQNKQKASQLLLDTDWVNQPDVTDTTIQPHLINKGAFDIYRLALRQIAVYPEAGNLIWPIKPNSEWSSI